MAGHGRRHCESVHRAAARRGNSVIAMASARRPLPRRAKDAARRLRGAHAARMLPDDAPQPRPWLLRLVRSLALARSGGMPERPNGAVLKTARPLRGGLVGSNPTPAVDAAYGPLEPRAPRGRRGKQRLDRAGNARKRRPWPFLHRVRNRTFARVCPDEHARTTPGRHAADVTPRRRGHVMAVLARGAKTDICRLPPARLRHRGGDADDRVLLPDDDAAAAQLDHDVARVDAEPLASRLACSRKVEYTPA